MHCTHTNGTKDKIRHSTLHERKVFLKKVWKFKSKRWPLYSKVFFMYLCVYSGFLVHTGSAILSRYHYEKIVQYFVRFLGIKILKYENLNHLSYEVKDIFKALYIKLSQIFMSSFLTLRKVFLVSLFLPLVCVHQQDHSIRHSPTLPYVVMCNTGAETMWCDMKRIPNTHANTAFPHVSINTGRYRRTRPASL